MGYLSDEGAGVAVTPHGVLPRDSHEISLPIGGGTQVDDFTRGFTKGFLTLCSYTFLSFAGRSGSEPIGVLDLGCWSSGCLLDSPPTPPVGTWGHACPPPMCGMEPWGVHFSIIFSIRFWTRFWTPLGSVLGSFWAPLGALLGAQIGSSWVKNAS